MGLHKILKIVALLLSIVGVIFYVMIVLKGDKAIESLLLEGDDVSSVNGALYTAYIMFGLVLLFVLGFVLKGIFAGNIKKTLISIGAFLVVVAISYAMASGSIEGLPLDDGEPVSESGSKWVGTGLYAFYIMAIVAIGTVVLSGVKKFTSK